MLEAYAVVVGDERMTKRATVERYRKVRTAVNGLLIAFAKSEEKFVLIRKTVIDAHRPGRVQNRIDRTKKEIVSQLILVSRGGFRNEFEDILCHGTDGNFIVRKSRTALYSAYSLSGGWVEDLSLNNCGVVARIGAQRIAGVQKEGKIASSLRVGRHSASSRGALLLPVLLPGKKEKRLIAAFVELGNPNRPS